MLEAKPSLKRRAVTEYFPSPINPWSFIRAVIPVGQTLDDPLVVYQIRRSQRTGSRPWMLVVMAYLVLIGEILYAAGMLAYGELETQFIGAFIGPMVGIVAVVLSLGVIYGHWRLVLAVFSRAAKVVTERRLRGDWELIAITPMPKARWLRAQLIGLGWQVWPLVRNLMIIQTVLVLIFVGVILYDRYDDRGDRYYYEDSSYHYLPLPVYMILTFPIFAALILEPLMMVAVLAALSFYISTLSKHPAMAMLYNFLGIFFIRSIIAAVFFYAGLFFVVFFFTFSPNNDLGDFEGASVLGFSLYTCIAVPITSFFVEWLPALGPLMVSTEARVSEHILLYLSIMCTGLTTYVATPLLLIRSLAARTVRRLQMRER